MTDRGDELLAQEDGRYFAIDKVGTGLGSISTGERIQKQIVNFGLPSGPALYLHLAHVAFRDLRKVGPRTLFDPHDQGIWPDEHGPLFDFFETSIAHIIFSFTAIEAFANKAIPPGFTYVRTRKGGTESFHGPELERQVNLDEKLATVLPRALSVSSPKQVKVWSRYVTLRRLRDRLIHLKSSDRKSSGPDIETIWGALLRDHDQPWCDYAHELIGHFGPAIDGRRWHGLYPYSEAP